MQVFIWMGTKRKVAPLCSWSSADVVNLIKSTMTFIFNQVTTTFATVMRHTTLVCLHTCKDTKCQFILLKSIGLQTQDWLVSLELANIYQSQSSMATLRIMSPKFEIKQTIPYAALSDKHMFCVRRSTRFVFVLVVLI